MNVRLCVAGMLFVVIVGCSGKGHNLLGGPGDGIGYVDLITEPHPLCKEITNSDCQRLTNRHPTRRVIIKKMTESNPSSASGPRVTIIDIVLEPAEKKKPFVGCVRHEDGRLVDRIIEEAWLYTMPE